jgi:peptidoglycan/xylan/chitin deacetylase (PgdA/CDA1 family)
MIECIFTLDYEIFGNGQGSLEEFVYQPAERLAALFKERHARFVVFVEVAELEAIEKNQADPYVDQVKAQVRSFYDEGFEIGLHVHPWWCNASYEGGIWKLDYSEYNLCLLDEARIASIIDRSIGYLRSTLHKPDFSPISYRSGHLLFQPTPAVARALGRRGIKVDSSVYRGGLWREQKQDYRKAASDRYYWRFSEDIVVPDPQGALLEVPIYTEMVPVWKMLTGKRVGLRRKVASASRGRSGGGASRRFLDRLRLLHPLKLDFCSMTMEELTRMVDSVIDEDQRTPSIYRPVVAIGHTKDLVDFETVERFLGYLQDHGIAMTTFERLYERHASGLMVCGAEEK